MRLRYFMLSAVLCGSFSQANAAPQLETQHLPSPKMTLSGNDWYIETRGRAELDMVNIERDQAPHEGGIYDRRTRFGFDAGFGDAWSATAEIDFSRDSDIEYTDVALRYADGRQWHASFGHFKESFGMERIDSSQSILFNERAAVDTFTPKRNLGAEATYYNDQATVTIGVFTDSFQSNSVKDELAFNTRGTYAFALGGGTLHTGIAASWRDVEQVSFSASPDTAATDIRAVSTGTIRDADTLWQGGLEAAYGWKNYLLAAEYMATHIDRTSAAYATLDGWYTQASWLLTGEDYTYNTEKSAIFQPVKPAQPFSLEHRTWGALEMALRYQGLSLNDASVQGGQLRAATAGINWYPNTAWRLTADATYLTTDAEAVTPQDDPITLGLRLRVSF